MEMVFMCGFDFLVAVLVILMTILASIKLLTWKRKRDEFIKLVDKIPGPKYNSLFGHSLLFNIKRDERFAKVGEVFKDYLGGPMIRLWLGGSPRVFLLKAQAAEPLLSSPTEIEKGSQYRFLTQWLRSGLLVNSGQSWHRRRKMLTPSFHFKIFAQFMDVFNKQAAILVGKTEKAAGQPIDYFNWMALCTLDIICESGLRRSVNAQQGENADYVEAVNDMQEIFSIRSFTPWYRNNFIFSLTKHGRKLSRHLKRIHSFSNKVIKERREEYQAIKAQRENHAETSSDNGVYGEKRRLAFLDLLLEAVDNGAALTHEDIQGEVDTFMFAGHDTTATEMSWVLYSLGNHPEIQKKVHDELDVIFGDSDREITTDDIYELKYLECVIKESMRLYSTVPFYARTLQEDLVTCGYTIPASTTVLVASYFIHRDPEHFPDPEKFDPERFAPENCAGRHPYAFVPFSAGPRNCIGQKFAMIESKVVLSHILRRFKVKSLQTFEELRVVGEIVLRPMQDMMLQFSNRTAGDC